MGLIDEMGACATGPLNWQICYARVSPVCRAVGLQRRSRLI
jgi:hypothetical protein